MNSPPSPLPEVPQPLQLVIYRALSKDPAGRYANCTELLDELQQFTADDNQPTATVDRRELRRRAQFAARALVPQPASRRFLWLAALLVALALLALSQFRGPAVPAPTSASQAKSAADSNPAAYDSYLKGRSYLQRYDKPGNLETAISLLEGTVRADPQFVLGFAALGEAYWQKYRIASDPRWLDQAEAYSRRAAELNDQLPAVHTTLGRVHEGRGQQELALQEFQRALKLDANNADAMQGQASIFGKQERLAQAETLYRTAAALRPDYWGGYHELARFYYAQHRYEEAAGQFRSAIELAPDNASAHANLGATLLAMGRQAEAEAEYRKSLTIVPTYSAFANLGSLYYLQKRFAASAQMTEEALQLNQSDYRLWGNLALAYEWLGQSGKARQAYDQELIRLEQIVRNKPEDARVQAELGRLYAGRNMPAKALPRMQASLVLAPGDKFVLIDAADTYEQLGRRPEAVAVLQTALRQGAVMDDLEADPILRALLSDQRAHRALQRAQRRTPKQP
jgi:serine/threonine-protein kinase